MEKSSVTQDSATSHPATNSLIAPNGSITIDTAAVLNSQTGPLVPMQICI
jgi:hypothetical protein